MGNGPINRHKYAGSSETVAGVVVGMGVLWVFLIFAISLTMAVIAPSQEYTIEQFMSMAGILTIGIAAVSMVGYRWVSRVPGARQTVRGADDEAVSPIVADFRVRSGMYRIAATALFLVLVGVTVGGFYVVSQLRVGPSTVALVALVPRDARSLGRFEHRRERDAERWPVASARLDSSVSLSDPWASAHASTSAMHDLPAPVHFGRQAGAFCGAR